jgi:hypothetical protein
MRSEIESALVRRGNFACLAFPTPIRDGMHLQTSDKLKISLQKTTRFVQRSYNDVIKSLGAGGIIVDNFLTFALLTHRNTVLR